MGLDDRKLKAIDLIIKGENISKVAEIVGVNRATIYNWMNDKNFKAELSRQTTELKSQIDKKLLTNIEPLLEKLVKIALKSKSDKTALDACIYAINRIVGTPTARTQDVASTNINKDPVDIDSLLSEIKEDNVIPIDKSK